MAGNWSRNRAPLLGVFVNGNGPLPAEYLFVAERPGKQDPAAGRLYAGASGTEFNRYLRLAGIEREDVRLTCLVRDYLDIEEPTENEILRDLPLLLQEMDDCSPRVIIPMGRAPIRFFLGDVDVEQVHGLAFDGTQFGYPGVTIYPVYSPSGGLYSGDNIPPIHHDFLGLGDIEGRAIPADRHVRCEYRQRTGRDLLSVEGGDAAVDSEGWAHNPYSIQFTQTIGQGLIVYSPLIATIRRDWNYFQSAGGRFIFHSSLHELPVLRAMGLSVRDGQFIDTMLLSYLLGLTPQGLKPLAYRLSGMEMESYQEVVGVARRDVQLEWLAAALSVAADIAPPDLELVWDDKRGAKGEWRVRTPHTIFRRLTALEKDVYERGKDVDIAERVAKWEDSAADELREVCGEVTEPTLGDIPPAKAEAYACRDADATLRIAPYLIRRVKEEGMERVAEIDHAIIPIVDQMQHHGILIEPDHFRELEGKWTIEMSEVRDQIEGMVGVRINPSSPDQVSGLLFKQLGLPSKKLTKGGDDSTQDKVLEALRHLHPVLPLIMDYRELDKMRGSFCRKMLKLMGPDHRVRGTIRITRTASGRLAMSSPNLMAIPVRMERGRLLREGFIAAPGNVIGNWDLDQIEMREIADASDDPLLIELFSDATRDIHSETAARMFDKAIALIDPKTERYAAKRVGFGIATQITGRGLVDQMELAGATHADGSHWTESECDDLIELWFGVYPGVRRFIDRVKAKVRRTGMATDRWGRIRHLEGIWSTLDRIRAEAERQGPSHEIQAGAQGVMKQNMARIWSNIQDLPEVKPLLQIHDSLMLEYPEEMHPLVNEIVMDGMENTVKYKVPITASGEYGYSWGKMELGDD